jgi:4-amino-4-deoxy-L-arabinose transferase-like glycosyltransferase
MKRVIYTGIFFGTFLAYVSAAIFLGTLNAPPDLGDGQDYDAIAFNLWHHRGYGVDWDDPEWREPYLRFPAHYKPVLERHSDFQLTAYRPPAMPYLLAFVYTVAGRNFAAWRILNCAIMAGAVTLAAAVSAELAGLWAAVITAALALMSPQLIANAQRFLTEGLAAFFVALLAWAWLAAMKKDRAGWRDAARIGIVLGLLVITRSVFILWLPLVLFFPGGRKLPRGFSLRPVAVCLLGFLAVVTPWWVRNILVTKTFMPFGTQGPIALTAAFGPRALEAGGLWIPDDGNGARELQAAHLDQLTFEVRLAALRSALALNWMRQHPIDVARLMALHVWQELRPRNHIFADLMLAAGLISAFLFRSRPAARVVLLFFFANIFSVALTWSVEGRFMIPVHPLLIALTAATAAGFCCRRFVWMERSLRCA